MMQTLLLTGSCIIREMNPLRVSLLASVLLFGILLGAAVPEAAIRSVLDDQVSAWNRGDLSAFVAPYAEHCTLVGKDISAVTRREVLDHYKNKYTSRDAMGKLTFSGLTIDPRGARLALVTGHWHLDRNAASGGPVGGVFSLVLESDHGAWQIVLDHTS